MTALGTYTAGPWDMQVCEECCFHEGNRVAITKWDKDGDEDINVTVAEVWQADNDTDLADGRLITAAPDLYQALKALLFNVEHVNGAAAWEESKEKARAAIAKVEGD